MIRLAIFDLDGTLLNTIADLGEACNHALSTFGYPVHQPEEYPFMVGNGVNNLILRSLPKEARDMDTVLRIKPTFTSYYDAHKCTHTQPYLGIPELLTSLRQMGIKLAVASNKYNEATNALISHYFGEQFDVVLGERPGVERKPNPQIIHDIFAHSTVAGILPEETIYIGDSDVDMQTAHNANLTSIGCMWGFCTRQVVLDNHPDYVANQPADILSIIQTIK